MLKHSLLFAVLAGLSASSALAQEATSTTLIRCQFQYYNTDDRSVPFARGPAITRAFGEQFRFDDGQHRASIAPVFLFNNGSLQPSNFYYTITLSEAYGNEGLQRRQFGIHNAALTPEGNLPGLAGRKRPAFHRDGYIFNTVQVSCRTFAASTFSIAVEPELPEIRLPDFVLSQD